ncbi:MAG: glycosyltransferase [Candidatus Methanoperedens sp.]|nr:glycosyltransferase [Candidatus Methanoperedens sp.]
MSDSKLLVLSYMVKEEPIDTGNNLIQAFIDNNALYLDYKELYSKYGFVGAHNYISEYVSRNEINCLIYFSNPSEFYFGVDFFEKLREEIFLVMITGDAEHYYEVRDQYYAQAMDLVVVNDFISPFKLRQIGINSIAYFGYFDTIRYHKIENLQKNMEVSFIGQLTGKVGRLNYINYLLKNNINVKVLGNDSLERKVSLENKIEIFNRTKINLNFSGIAEETILTRKYRIHTRAKQIKGRIFEIASCGGFVLSEYAPGLERLFEIGNEIDVFYDKEELLEKVKYYLEHDGEREEIARRGCERATKDYDVKQAVPKLISAIDELRKNKIYKPSEIYLDDEFVRNYTTYRILLTLRFVKAGKLKFALEELKIILKYRKLDWYQIRIFFQEESLRVPQIKSVLKLMRDIKK